MNEELDLELLVRRLKQENALLRQELQLLRSGGTVVPGSDSTGGAGEASAAAGSGPEQQQALSEAEHQVLRRQVQAYVEDTAPDASLDVQASMLFIHAAFGLLKGMVRGGPAWGHQPAALSGSSSSNSGPEAAAAEVRSLRQLVQDQEQQIGVLAGVLRKQGLSPDMLQQADNHPSSSSSSPHHATTSATGHGATSALAFSEELLEDQHKAVSRLPNQQHARFSAWLICFAPHKPPGCHSLSTSAPPAQHTTRWRSTRLCCGASTRRRGRWAPAWPPASSASGSSRRRWSGDGWRAPWRRCCGSRQAAAMVAESKWRRGSCRMLKRRAPRG